MKLKIGVFDSGIGGLSVVNAIKLALPECQIVFKNDAKNLPYGNKDPDVLYGLVEPILKNLVESGCNIIVVACNTVTTTLINKLRQNITVPLIGMEPMVKPASKKTKSGIIAVFATPTTLSSSRYYDLKNNHAHNIKVLEPDCSDWSTMIEANTIDNQKIIDTVNLVCDKGADTLVLGCTHYHWIEDLIKQIAGNRAEVLQPEPFVINQIKRVIKDKEL